MQHLNGHGGSVPRIGGFDRCFRLQGRVAAKVIQDMDTESEDRESPSESEEGKYIPSGVPSPLYRS